MRQSTELRERILKQLKAIVLEQLATHKVRVFLFGSWARKEEKQSSDIDIAIESPHPFPPGKWNALMESIEESTIPYKVDVVDLNHADIALVKKVEEEGIIWKDYGSD
ncbi:nucleotidyltransferase family protein [Thalassobacillus pellis]|uniref:nucleotidyltransferase family protein n=1 Tax=Thalassobacillus pellis TaxID=748008 RepID=UPI001961CE69|nr:nucleotidyltransferase domain-containing protein [Thalassobacillus pellis]MBM7554439.1 putative nucleotidyltransferase [Thalassobacillus pellis]